MLWESLVPIGVLFVLGVVWLVLVLRGGAVGWGPGTSCQSGTPAATEKNPHEAEEVHEGR